MSLEASIFQKCKLLLGTSQNIGPSWVILVYLDYPRLMYVNVIYHNIPYYVSYYIILYHIISYYIILYHIITYYIILNHVKSYYIILYHRIWWYPQKGGGEKCKLHFLPPISIDHYVCGAFLGNTLKLL